jgi:hypothetical protein
MKVRDINKTGKFTHMVADDLFLGVATKQVFSAKTGKWLGTIDYAEQINFKEVEEELDPEPQVSNPNQLSLFQF